MRSTPIEKMEATAGIPPLNKRWECKGLIQHAKAQTIKIHLMHTRTTKDSREATSYKTPDSYNNV
jgi:hypothetical protein